jgi:hypothetical protein
LKTAHSWPTGQPHCGTVSLHGDVEQVPLLLDVVEVLNDELLAKLAVVVTMVAPPCPLSDDPSAQAVPASTSAPMVGSKRDRMARTSPYGAYAYQERGQRFVRLRVKTIRIRPGPA